MGNELLGIHHVTAIASDPQRNLDFYTGVLGLRLVKLTVNFDDPGTYHLYYGDPTGTPGTILTFFAWPAAGRGRKGNGQATIVSFTIPAAGLRYWAERLEDLKIAYEGPIARFNDRLLTFFDPDGCQIELVAQPEAVPGAARPGRAPAEYAIQRICGVTLAEADRRSTLRMFGEVLGLRGGEEAANRWRYWAGDARSGSYVDVLEMPGLPPGKMLAGSIHHVAWRTPDDASQGSWRLALLGRGISTTPVQDRQYFHSIYFREPGGALFEIATDPPGFLIDEPIAELGTQLKLPPWLEPRRGQIERSLPPLRLPQPAQ